MDSKSFFKNESDEGEGSKLFRKVKESPFLIAGLTGFVTAAAIGAYKFKNRGNMSASLFLMQLRVAAQGTVVGCLTIGLAYTMANEYIFNKKPKEDSFKN